MPQLVHDDPAVFYPGGHLNPQAMLFHEVGHLVLAYYYGFAIGGFRYRVLRGQVTGAVKNKRSEEFNRLNSWQAASFESTKLLAAELAARLFAGLPTDEIVIPLDAPPPHLVTSDTPFSNLRWPRIPQDGCRVLQIYRDHIHCRYLIRLLRYICGRSDVTDNWWSWLWACHDRAHTFLQDHWNETCRIVDRLTAVGFGTPTSGETLVTWCQQENLPIRDPELIPQPYTPDD